MVIPPRKTKPKPRSLGRRRGPFDVHEPGVRVDALGNPYVWIDTATGRRVPNPTAEEVAAATPQPVPATRRPPSNKPRRNPTR